MTESFKSIAKATDAEIADCLIKAINELTDGQLEGIDRWGARLWIDAGDIEDVQLGLGNPDDSLSMEWSRGRSAALSWVSIAIHPNPELTPDAPAAVREAFIWAVREGGEIDGLRDQVSRLSYLED